MSPLVPGTLSDWCNETSGDWRSKAPGVPNLWAVWPWASHFPSQSISSSVKWKELQDLSLHNGGESIAWGWICFRYLIQGENTIVRFIWPSDLWEMHYLPKGTDCLHLGSHLIPYKTDSLSVIHSGLFIFSLICPFIPQNLPQRVSTHICEVDGW